MRFSFGWWRAHSFPFRFKIPRPRLRIWPVLENVRHSLTPLERRLLLVLVTAAAIGGAGFVQNRSSANFVTVPLDGGIYREGILTSSPKDEEAAIDALTKVGFVRMTGDGILVPALAKEWQTSEDGLSLRLTLNDQLTADAAKEVLMAQTEPGYWKEAEINVLEPQVLEFRLAKPWAGFVTELARPIFPYGPFKVSETNEKEDRVKMVVNERALAKPHLTKLELSFSLDPRLLDKGIRKHQFDGVYFGDSALGMLPDDWVSWEPELVREEVIIFNLRQKALESSAVRQRLLRGEALTEPLTLRLVAPDTAEAHALAEDLRNRWAPLNVTLTIELYPVLALNKTVLPERNYDLLLIGLDYGLEKDLYPYWHSSQMASPGFNFAGYRNKEVDRILDETRRQGDAHERTARYEQVRQLVSADAAFMVLKVPTVTYVRADKVKGEVPKALPTTTERWTEIANWYTKEKRVKKTENQ